MFLPTQHGCLKKDAKELPTAWKLAILQVLNMMLAILIIKSLTFYIIFTQTCNMGSNKSKQMYFYCQKFSRVLRQSSPSLFKSQGLNIYIQN